MTTLAAPSICIVCAVEHAKVTPVNFILNEQDGGPMCDCCKSKGRFVSLWNVTPNNIITEAEIRTWDGNELLCEFSGATINHWHDCLLKNPLVLNGYFKKAPWRKHDMVTRSKITKLLEGFPSHCLADFKNAHFYQSL